jgi:hypothetical protein
MSYWYAIGLLVYEVSGFLPRRSRGEGVSRTPGACDAESNS